VFPPIRKLRELLRECGVPIPAVIPSRS